MKITKNQFVILSYAIIVIVLGFSIFFHNKLPFSQDWNWPLFSAKYYFWNTLTQFDGGLISIFGKSGVLVFSILGYAIQSPSLLFKITIFLIQFTAAYSFYNLCKRFTNSTVAFIAGLAYALTPYFFIRVIMGFLFSLTAYAILPLFINLYFFKEKKKLYHFLILGLLLSLIFAQIQAGLLVLLVLFVYLFVSIFNRSFVISIKNFALVILSFIVVNLPWIILALLNRNNLSVPEGGSVTTLGRMASILHIYRNILMTSDFEFTSQFFLLLAKQKLYLFGWLIVWFVAACSILSKKNRTLVLVLILASISVLTLIKGPVGIFGGFYMFVFNHFPQIMVFRDTDHFIFLLAFSLCFMFAVGLDWLWQQIDCYKLAVSSKQSAVKKSNSSANSKPQTANLIGLALKSLTAGSAIFVIAPYLTFDYAGYSPVRQIPTEYTQLYSYFQYNKDVCQKIYYPPGLDFVFFKWDKLPGASNSDSIASNIGIPYVSGGTSILNTPSEEMFYLNELISQFYEANDNGEFVNLLSDEGVDCVVARQDMDTKYDQAMNLKFEKDRTLLKKWNQNDWLSMTKSKKGMKLEKQFGDNIFVYKVDSTTKLPIDRNYEITNKVGNPTIQQFSNLAIVSLRLTDWANVNSYYKNGWSRGRYDFWRKHLFTQLRQDFIYTDKGDSVLKGKIDQKGDYEVWTRSLVGGSQGSYQLSALPAGRQVNSYQYIVTKEQGDEKFVWKKLDDIKIDGKTDIEIKNISGENAIADVVLVKK